jgi:hypothetical protein
MPDDNENWDVESTEEAEENEQDVVTYQISYYPADITLKGYDDKWKAEQLYVPPFQRNYVWDQVQASKLIESFLLGLPVPGVFLYKERKSNRLQIIDGQQRILTAVRFFKNEFGDRAFRLKNVQAKWNGKRYEDLVEADRFQLQDAVLRATVVQQLDPNDDSSIYHIFERLNTGGMKLMPMEIRKCVYLSDFYNLLEELNHLPSWKRLIGRVEDDKRLRDVELMLRVLALVEKWKEYEKPMKKFLNDFMAEKKRLEGEALSVFIARTRESATGVCDYLLEQLGERPFHLRGRLNYAVLDSTMSVSFRALARKTKHLKARYAKLTADKTYFAVVTQNTSDEKSVASRFELAEKYLLP